MPGNIKEIFKDDKGASNVHNYIISKVASSGFAVTATSKIDYLLE